jgi:hypothetical protein
VRAALSILGCQRLREKVGVRYTFNCVLWFRKFEQQLSAYCGVRSNYSQAGKTEQCLEVLGKPENVA